MKLSDEKIIVCYQTVSSSQTTDIAVPISFHIF